MAIRYVVTERRNERLDEFGTPVGEGFGENPMGWVLLFHWIYVLA